MQPHCSGLVFKFLMALYPASWALFEQDGIVSVVELREIFVSDVHSQITNAAAEDSVAGTVEESRSRYAPLTDTGCCEETVR